MTALEIVGNPYDLHFVIAEAKNPGPNGSWYLAVNRGPCHSFKPLLSTDQLEQLRPSREDALYVIEMGVLYMALAGVQIPKGDEGLKKVNDAEGREAKMVAMREAIEKSISSPDCCLTLSLVDRIMIILTERGECLTSEMELVPRDPNDASQHPINMFERIEATLGMSPNKVGFPHDYPGDPAKNAGESWTSNCLYGCRCWAGGSRSGGPDGLDPFGECPKHPDRPISKE